MLPPSKAFKSASVTGQEWRLADAGRGAHRLTTTFTGSRFALTASPRSRSISMLPSTADATQRWEVRWASNGAYRITSVAAGEGLSLDTPDPRDGRPSLATSATVSGQLWRIDRQ